MAGVTLDDVRRAAATLTGDILQVPPMVSAVKIDGKRLHELARQGKEVDRPARPVSVYRFEVDELPGRPGVFHASVDCSSGTYIRVLAADIGHALGGGAHLPPRCAGRRSARAAPRRRPLAGVECWRPGRPARRRRGRAAGSPQGAHRQVLPLDEARQPGRGRP
jgi:hypothetical protein